MDYLATQDLKGIDVEGMLAAFAEAQQPRTPYVLEHFVLGQHDTEPQAYAQCIVELQIAYYALKKAGLEKKKKLLEIEELEKSAAECGDQYAAIDVQSKRLDLEEMELAALGKFREFEYLYCRWQSFSKKFTREDLNAAQPEYWVKRLERQAYLDRLSTGRVGHGNLDALRMIGRSPMPELDHVRDVEKRYLEVGDVKVLIAIPTVEKLEALPEWVKKLEIPSGVQVKYYNVHGRATDEAYNDAVMTLLNDGADLLLTIEDDTVCPPDALVKLLGHVRNGCEAVGAWYPKRTESLEGVHIVVRAGKRQALSADGGTHEVYTLAMGCSLFTKEMFLKTTHPWFATTSHLTQDSFFSQKAREAGFKLWCDTSILCKHVDRETGAIYEKDGITRP